MTTRERALHYMLDGTVPCKACKLKNPQLVFEDVQVLDWKKIVRVKIRCIRDHKLGKKTLRLNELLFAEQNRPWHARRSS